MNREVEENLEEIERALVSLKSNLQWDKAIKQLEILNNKAEDTQLWDDPEGAQSIMRDRLILQEKIQQYQELERAYYDSKELYQLAETEKAEDLMTEIEQSITSLRSRIEKIQLENLLAGEADNNDCFLEIHAGAGGTEAQDWAQMLLRMYSRWSEKRAYKIEVMEESEGEEAGLKSITIKIKGLRAYGWLKNESGVHRLVRISPFDASARRHTSFASVWVFPVVDETIDISIEEKDLRIDTFRASGAGGQHVNKTESAIRITHMPTNIVVQCQTDRSQHRNKATALSMLKSRLYELELQKRQQEKESSNANKTEIGWGHQIRSYVLQPYQIVKDLRTGVEKTDAAAVLEGDIDDFIEAALGFKTKSI